MESTAKRRWAGSFAGLWRGRRGRIFIAFTGKARKRVKRLRQVLPQRSRILRHRVRRKLRPRLVARSLASMRQRQERMIADRDNNHFRRVPPYSLDIDVTRNALVITLDPDHFSPWHAAMFKYNYGADVIVEPERQPDFYSCTQTSCGKLLRSGLRSSTGSRACTTAFNVTSKSFGSLALTAGHCGGFDVGKPRYHNGIKYGYVLKEQRSGNVEAEVHHVNSNGFKATKPWKFIAGSQPRLKIYGVWPWNATFPGLPVCKTGITTGFTCGIVTSKHFSPSPVPNSHSFVKTTMCAQPGDSGSGVITLFFNPATFSIDGMAHGVLSGGPKDTPCSHSQHYSYLGHLQFALPAFGVTLRKVPFLFG